MESGQRRRPAYLRNMSSYFLFGTRRKGVGVGVGEAATAADEQTSWLPTHADPQRPSPVTTSNNTNYQAISSPASDKDHHRLSSAHAALAPTPRPNLPRAVTTAIASRTEHAGQPLLSRPKLLDRALTSTAAVAGRPELYTESAMESRPSLFSRAKTVISNQLELGEGTSYAHKNKPPTPSHWDDQTHRRAMVKLWDSIEDRIANSNSKYPVSTTSRVVSAEKNMLHYFPELGEGESVLTREWIEYVLGVALRHPFCTADKMGRWEILASSSGARGTWGPW